LKTTFAVVVPWHDAEQLHAFLGAWGIERSKSGSTMLPPYLLLERDATKAGCAQTKNAGIKRALASGADYIIVLDDDCYPAPRMPGQPETFTLQDLAAEHIAALRPQKVPIMQAVTFPASRGTPYLEKSVSIPIAMVMGFWAENPDLDALHTLVIGPQPEMRYAKMALFHQWFAWSGMNFSFHRDWADCAMQIEGVPRFEDIWQGFILMKVAYEKGFALSTKGPMVRHSRQSNTWRNLEDEVKYLELNEKIWQAIYKAPSGLSAAQYREMFFSPARDLRAVLSVDVPRASPEISVFTRSEANVNPGGAPEV
jgi:hypothetical protein